MLKVFLIHSQICSHSTATLYHSLQAQVKMIQPLFLLCSCAQWSSSPCLQKTSEKIIAVQAIHILFISSCLAVHGENNSIFFLFIIVDNASRDIYRWGFLTLSIIKACLSYFITLANFNHFPCWRVAFGSFFFFFLRFCSKFTILWGKNIFPSSN